jgi:hypothetical protein
MLVKIALVLMIFWLIGLFTPYETGVATYTLPVIALVMIMVSGHRRMLNNPYDN